MTNNPDEGVPAPFNKPRYPPGSEPERRATPSPRDVPSQIQLAMSRAMKKVIEDEAQAQLPPSIPGDPPQLSVPGGPPPLRTRHPNLYHASVDPPRIAENWGVRDTPQGKWWLASRTIVGAIIVAIAALVPTIFGIFGVKLDQQLLDTATKQLIELVQLIFELIGLFLVVYGRIKAEKPLESKWTISI